jgi:hypothetical protein
MDNKLIDNKICDKCSQTKSLDNYRKYNEISFSKTCKKCLNEVDKLRKKKLRQKKAETYLAICEKCNFEKKLCEFSKLKKNYKKKICLSCYPKFLTEQKTEWYKKEQKSNINYRLKKSLASRLRNVLSKKDSTMNYIGCNIQYLREWFEYNFTLEMNWENYGSYWSIDHILPVNKFDLTNENEKLCCWNWSNLMPVSVTYNSSKKNRIDLIQIENIIKKLEKFKEEGSTTKWFSEEFLLNRNIVEEKLSQK